MQVKAYAELHKLVEKYKKKIIALEKQRYFKEKAFYNNEENVAKAQQAA